VVTRPACRRGRLRHRVYEALVVVLTIALTTVILVPVVWMFSASVRPIRELLVYPPRLIPETVTLDYFARILHNAKYQRFFVNSILLSLFCLAVTLVLASLAGYGFSRFRMRGGRAMLIGILALLMLPRVTVIVPYFRMAHTWGVYDRLLGLMLVNVAFLLPMATWLLKGYMDSVPVELEEAAMVDGCTRTGALRRVLLPLALPGLVGVGTFVFIGAWNEYLLAVVLTDTPSAQTLTVGLAAFFGEYVRDWNSIMALSTLTSVPLMLVFVFFQRWVVQGMTSGAVK
jgi:multiple sugar transport system permease protein